MHRSTGSRVTRSLALLFMPLALFGLVFAEQRLVQAGRALPPDTLHFAVVGDYGYVATPTIANAVLGQLAYIHFVNSVL